MRKPIQINLNDFFDAAPSVGSIDSLKIGVALSGGRDSVVLVHVLKQSGAHIFAVNIEHGIRGESSISDSRFVKDWCKQQGVDLKAYCVDAPMFCRQHGYTLEQGARILRYEIFDRLLQSGECDYIALAHHAGDQTETIFLRILRGTGIKGLVGMRPISGRYIRPLLDYSREDIDQYIAEHSLNYVEDESNSDSAYTRNFIREQLAVIRERFPSLDEAAARLARNAQENESFIEGLVPHPSIVGDEAHIDVSVLDNPLIAKKAVMLAANAVGVYQDIEERHFPIIFGLAATENGKRIELPHGLSVHKQDGALVFAVRNALDESVSNMDEIPFGEGEFDRFGICAVMMDKPPSSFVGAQYIDVDKLPDGAVFRLRRDGDYICKFGGGTKSLGDFLTDKKIPLRKRGELVVLVVGQEVYAVVGVEISAKVALDKDTKRICKLTLTENR